MFEILKININFLYFTRFLLKEYIIFQYILQKFMIFSRILYQIQVKNLVFGLNIWENQFLSTFLKNLNEIYNKVIYFSEFGLIIIIMKFLMKYH